MGRDDRRVKIDEVAGDLRKLLESDPGALILAVAKLMVDFADLERRLDARDDYDREQSERS